MKGYSKSIGDKEKEKVIQIRKVGTSQTNDFQQLTLRKINS